MKQIKEITVHSATELKELMEKLKDTDMLNVSIEYEKGGEADAKENGRAEDAL